MEKLFSFSWIDYILFTTLLGISASVGIYFGCFGTKQSTTEEYLMGNKRMRIIPVAISMIASHTSAVTILGLPTDVYDFGASYWLVSVTFLVVNLTITSHIFLPVFFKLGYTSLYEYIEKRFDKRTRLCASLIYTVNTFLYLPVITYVPALAFSAASGLNVHVITSTMCIGCIFYTSIGGLKSVIWTDTIQFSLTWICLVAVSVLGVNSSGGWTKVWNTANQGHRLDIFDFDLDPTKRDTFWMVTIGSSISVIAITAVHQTCTQKLLALPTLRQAKWAIFTYTLGYFVAKMACMVIGLSMYTRYKDCDPLKSKSIEKSDELVPYYVMDIANHIFGLPGLFIAGTFSASLSTFSAYINCLAGTIYEDFFKKFLSQSCTQKRITNILKLSVVLFGCITIALVFVIENFSGAIALNFALNGATNGPMAGLFILGVLCPRINAKGAFFGAITSLIIMIFIVFGRKYYEAMGILSYEKKPLGTSGCNFMVNSTIIPFSNITLEESHTFTKPWPIFYLPFYCYDLVGMIITLVIGTLVSYCTQKGKLVTRKELVSPLVYFMVHEASKVDDVMYSPVKTTSNANTEF